MADRTLSGEVKKVEAAGNPGDKIKMALALMQNPPPLQGPDTEDSLEKKFFLQFGNTPLYSYRNGLANWFIKQNPKAAAVGFPHGPMAVMDREEGVKAAMPFGGYYGPHGTNPFTHKLDKLTR